MKYSILQLKDIQNRIADGFGLTPAQAARIVGHYNGSEELDRIAAGDFSPVESACNLLGFTPTKAPTEKKEEKTTEKPKRTPRKSTIKQETRFQDSIPTVTGEIVDSSELLPPNFPETVRGWLVDLAELHNIDIEKCTNIQWHSLCMDIGERIQKSGILRDREKEKRTGATKAYNPEILLALIPIWEKITGYYKHIPLAVDYIAFTGVHRNYFYDYEERGLTSSRVQLAKKVKDIEEAALSVALTDSRENPTGRIYYTKARLGWRETTEIIHTSAKETQQAASLPVFDGAGGLLGG